MAGLKLNVDVLLNYVTNSKGLKKQFDNLKDTYTNVFEGQGFYNDPIKRRIKAHQEATRDTKTWFKELMASYEKINKQGGFAYLFEEGGLFKRRRKDQKRLSDDQLEIIFWQDFEKNMQNYFRSQKKATTEQMKAYQKEEEAWKKYAHADENEQAELEEDREWLKQLKEGNKNSKGMNAMLKNILKGRWGAALGATIGGAILYAGYRVVRAAARKMYATSQTGLDWQRTISGGASGGTWFGQGLAAYERAGINANQYQGFKRGIQGYLGQVKLGMGNAAPLMYLGLSALGNPDELEKELENSLRRLPKDVSLALASQMGLDYNMWEAIYSGRIDRDRSAYSEEAIKEWSDLARSLNDLITTLNSFFFNTFAPFAESVANIINHFIDKKSGLKTIGNMASFGIGYLNPVTQIPTLIKFGALDVFIKDKDGETVGSAQANVDTIIQI